MAQATEIVQATAAPSAPTKAQVKAATTTLNRLVDADLLKAKETRAGSSEFAAAFKGSNSAKKRAFYNVVAERIAKKINADGSRMSLKQEITLRKAEGYGTPEYIKKLEDELAGESKEKPVDLAQVLAVLK